MVKVFRNFSVFSIFCFCTNILFAQNDVMFTQFMQNRLLLSPGFAGSDKGLDVAAVFRFQNVGLSNRLSSSQAISASASVDVIKGGAGITLVNDMIGLQRTTLFNVNYVYQHRFKKLSVGAGIGIGFVNYGLNGSAIVTPEGEYQSGTNHSDPNLSASKSSSTAPDFSAGVYVGNKKYFASLSVNHLYTSLKVKGEKSSFVYNYDRSLVLSGGYNFKITEKLNLEPSMVLRTNFQKVQTDIAAILSIYTYVSTGFSIRGYDSKSIDAFCLFLGGNVKGFRITYSYDISISYLKSFNSGSHEISLKYYMPFKTNGLEGKYYYNSRYL